MWRHLSPATAPLRCSFCTKSQNEVRKLVAGPKVYICDECIELCNDILAEEEEESRETADESRDDAGARLPGAAPCALCDVPTSMDVLVVVPKRGFLCFACLDAIRTATEPETANGQ